MDARLTLLGLTNLEEGFTALVEDIPMEQQKMLDEAAEQAKMLMMQQAPHGINRQWGTPLAESITISTPESGTRVIEPEGRNISPGNKYALSIEKGFSGGKMPNVESVGLYYGVDSKKLAFAIALGIKKKGATANPFVARTYEMIWPKMEGLANVFLTTVASSFGTGAIR